MTGRRREENWFRYGRACFAPDDPDRKVANPAKKTASATVSAARKALAEAGTTRQRKLDQLRSTAPPGNRHHQRDARETGRPRRRRPPRAPSCPGRCQGIPAKIPLRDHNLDMVRLDAETKLIMHAVKDWQIPGTVDTSR
jgi:hypothetical protein